MLRTPRRISSHRDDTGARSGVKAGFDLRPIHSMQSRPASAQGTQVLTLPDRSIGPMQNRQLRASLVNDFSKRIFLSKDKPTGTSGLYPPFICLYHRRNRKELSHDDEAHGYSIFSGDRLGSRWLAGLGCVQPRNAVA
jgi:hypothetical protein